MRTINDLLYSKPTHALIGSGVYREHKWAILNVGGHYPVAYVEFKGEPDNISYSDKFDNIISVHCGVTFNDYCYWNVEDKSFYLGWDYGHCCDFINYDEKFGGPTNGIKHTYDEIKGACLSAIDEMIEKGY